VLDRKVERNDGWQDQLLEMTQPIARGNVVHQARTGRDGRGVQRGELFTPEAVQLTDLVAFAQSLAAKVTGKPCRGGF